MPLAESLGQHPRVIEGLNSRFRLHYETNPSWPIADEKSATPEAELNIAVLDSSFNPPTNAHLAMGSAPAPLVKPYDAALLLLASVNADKGSSTKAGHPGPTGRVQLMCLCADALSEQRQAPAGGIAVATTTLPFFAEKSRILVQALRDLTERRVRLHWLVGWDTLERIFASRYYIKEGLDEPPSEALRKALYPFLGENGDGSRLVVFRRALESEDATDRESAFLSREVVKDFVRQGKISVVDLPRSKGFGVSSTALRDAVAAGNWEEAAKLTDWRILQRVRERQLYIAPEDA